MVNVVRLRGDAASLAAMLPRGGNKKPDGWAKHAGGWGESPINDGAATTTPAAASNPWPSAVAKRWRWVLPGGCRCREIMLLVLAVTALVAMWGVGRFFSGDDTSYVLVVDAGSTGTRIYAYSWREGIGDNDLPRIQLIPPSAAPDKIPPRSGIRAYERVETLPGLDSCRGDVDKLRGECLGPLLDWAKAVVHKTQQASTPLFLFATSGVRRLPKDQQNDLMKDVKQVLSTSGFRFEADWAQIINGQEEGAFGWFALNYLKGRLKAPVAISPAPSSGTDSAAKNTVNVLDLGGASLEATFEMQQEAHLGNEFHNQTLAGTTYFLKTEEYQNDGLNVAFDRSVTVLLQQMQNTSQVPDNHEKLLQIIHPCLQNGYDEAYTRRTHQEYRNVQLLGSPDWAGCLNLVEEVLNHTDICNGPCTSNAHEQQIRGEVAGLNGFHVVWEFYNLTSSSTFDQLMQSGKEFCQRNWTDVKQGAGDVVELDRYCFRAPYVSLLLQNGLKLENDKIEVDDNEIGWTLGAALLLSDKLWSHKTMGEDIEIAHPSRSPLLLLRAIYVVLVVSCLLAVWLILSSLNYPLGRLLQRLRLGFGNKKLIEQKCSELPTYQANSLLPDTNWLSRFFYKKSYMPVDGTHPSDGDKQVNINVEAASYSSNGMAKRRALSYECLSTLQTL